LICLELIQEASQRIFLKEADYNKWLLERAAEGYRFYSVWTEKDFTKPIAKYKAIKERLIKWYADIFERLQSETGEFRTPEWLKGIEKENIGTPLNKSRKGQKNKG
jgi:hypothetical protein